MFDVCLINSYLVFSFWFLLFAFFYDNVTAIRCINAKILVLSNELITNVKDLESGRFEY